MGNAKNNKNNGVNKTKWKLKKPLKPKNNKN